MPAPVEKSNQEESDGLFVATRFFDAPRRLLFEVWTEASHFSRWFGPRDIEVQVRALEPRPGGLIHFGHRFTEGPTLWVKGTFLEVEKERRLVFTSAFVDAEGRPAPHPAFPDWPLDAVLTTTVNFEDEGQGTKLTVHQAITPASALASAAVQKERPLAREGWGETLDRLAEIVRQMS